MSNKLYTEYQIRKVIELSRTTFYNNSIMSEEGIMSSLDPIELPSDEEIEQYLKSFPYTKHLDDGQYNDGVICGAELGIRWIIDKIQGGNNEQ